MKYLLQYSYLHLALPFIKKYMNFSIIARIIINNKLYRITDLNKAVKGRLFLNLILMYQLKRFINK